MKLIKLFFIPVIFLALCLELSAMEQGFPIKKNVSDMSDQGKAAYFSELGIEGFAKKNPASYQRYRGRLVPDATGNVQQRPIQLFSKPVQRRVARGGGKLNIQEIDQNANLECLPALAVKQTQVVGPGTPRRGMLKKKSTVSSKGSDATPKSFADIENE